MILRDRHRVNRILGPRCGEILKAIAAGLFPSEGPQQIGAEDVDIAGPAERFLAGFGPVTLLCFKLTLITFEYSTFPLALSVKRFSRMSREDQSDYLAGWENSRIFLRRGAFIWVKAVCGLLFYSDRDVERSIGYEPTC